jgi:exocyst complex component 4
MSRQPPPFPSKRPALPGIDTSQYPSPPIKPLQINRTPRPTTPSNASQVSSGSPTGPSRPQRSDLRVNRAPDYPVFDDTLQSRASRDRRDSASTTRSDMSGSKIYRTANGNTSSPRPRRPTRSGTEESDASTPASLSSVMSAFQSGLRKKAMRSHSDSQWDERQQAVEAENATQERIKRRIPGRKQTGASKTGDIDGTQ